MDEETKNILADFEKRISALEKLFEAKPDVVQKEISPREFFIEKNPKSDVEKTLVFAAYCEKYKLMSAYNAEDLADMFRQAKEQTPKNINLNVYRNIQKGFMME